jgi:hypothetical protein
MQQQHFSISKLTVRFIFENNKPLKIHQPTNKQEEMRGKKVVKKLLEANFKRVFNSKLQLRYFLFASYYSLLLHLRPFVCVCVFRDIIIFVI